MARHSHWAKIKRAKGANDAKRGKLWSKIARKIIIAARGGGDPRDNLALRYVIDEARLANMPKDTIEKAIQKGTGELGANNYEPVIYEGYIGGIALLIEALTNNRARTAPEVRSILEKHGAKMAPSGAAAKEFVRQGIISVKADAVEEDRLIELALEAGAEDVRNAGEVFEVITAPADFHKVKDALTAGGTPVEAAEIANLPLNPIPVDAEMGARIMRLVDALEDNDDIQSVSHNAELPEGAEV